MYEYTVAGKTISIFPGKKINAPIIYLNTFGKEGEEVWNILQKTCSIQCSLAVISGIDWNKDMIPWDAPSAFNDAGYCKGADEYLEILANKIIPETEKIIGGDAKWRGIAGYSLGGLFALYSLYKTNLFSRAASISGSLWFPRFKKFIETEKIQAKPLCLYFSLGKKEASTRNMYLKHVQMDTEAIVSYFSEKGIDVMYHLNPGGHFTNPEKRTADGLKWLLEEHDENKES